MAVYGIDFGTCYSCIALAGDNGNIEVIPSRQDQNTTPSVVMFNLTREGRPVVGATAKRALQQRNVQNVVAFTKTEMHADTMQREYEITRDRRERISPIVPAACIYHEIFTHANRHLAGQQKPTSRRAVITVPAVCTDIQREKTKIAAQLAGIEVLQVINEPTAAAISYNIGKDETVMVFDLGGGTLDVSIIYCKDKDDYSVLSSQGNATLGGRDWDRKLIELCYDMEGLDFDPSAITPQQMMEFENHKIDLCINGNALITFDDAGGTLHSVEVELVEFQQFTAPLVEGAMRVIDMALEDARKSNKNLKIDRVCMAGGSSKMPAIRSAIERHLTNVRVDLSDPDQAIAKGAARYALSLAKGKRSEEFRVDDRGHAYGILTTDNTGRLMVENYILRSDPMVIESRRFDRYMPCTDDKLRITIIENDVTAHSFRYNDHHRYYDDFARFNCMVTIGERVEFSLSRDADGLVHLSCDCRGNHRDITFPTQVSDLPDDIKNLVTDLLSKMDNQ